MFIEIGFDPDNHLLGFGISTELKFEDREVRKRGLVAMSVWQDLYLRLWIGKQVHILSIKEGYKCQIKTRKNVKFVLGIKGKP
ncbi:DUF3977 family protein [Streptococcus himalayensis]|uniref:DUF3977 family protein n=1 Tax=Streptococcus himalayensis TaxID=1888195 RepID=UPI0011AB83F6